MAFNPTELLREMMDSFSLEQDLEMIDRIQESMQILQQEREQEIKVTQNELLRLSSVLKKQQDDIDELNNDPKRLALKENIKENAKLELDYSKNLKSLAIDKQSLNTKLSHLIDEFTRLENDLDSLQSITPKNGTNEDEDDQENLDNKLDSVVLKLMVYRKLGLKLDIKSKTAIIFNKKKNLTDFLNYGDEKYSDYFVSNYIWDRIGN